MTSRFVSQYEQQSPSINLDGLFYLRSFAFTGNERKNLREVSEF